MRSIVIGEFGGTGKREPAGWKHPAGFFIFENVAAGVRACRRAVASRPAAKTPGRINDLGVIWNGGSSESFSGWRDANPLRQARGPTLQIWLNARH